MAKDNQELTKSQKSKQAPTSPSKKINLNDQKQNKYYEPSKQEQLDAVSYNRSYYVKVK